VVAVVFDFDGVLADSEPLHLRGFQAVLHRRGLAVPADDYYDRFLGYNDEDALVAMSEQYGWALSRADVQRIVAEKMKEMARLLASPAVLFAGAAACVRRLGARLPLAIASGAQRDEIELVLRANDLYSEFRAIVASGDTARSKPSPDPYARAVALLQTSGAVADAPEVTARCVAIEDSQWGIQSAQAAGLRCVAITTSYPAAALEGADAVIDRLEELTIDRLEALVERRHD
jgi:beta-phosphoglucomutase